MPLTAEQTTALDALKGADPDELADAFHKSHGKAAQVLIDQGNASAAKAKGTEIRKLEKDLEKANEEHEKTKDKLAESDPAKVQKQYQDEIKELKEQHKTEVAQLKASGVERERGRDLAKLEAKLVGKLKPMAIKAILSDAELAKRFQYGEDGSRSILQRGKEIPYAPSKDQDALDLLSADLIEHVKGIDADSVIAQAAPGGGSGGGGEGASGYDPVKAGKEAAKRQKGEEGRKGLAFT